MRILRIGKRQDNGEPQIKYLFQLFPLQHVLKLENRSQNHFPIQRIHGQRQGAKVEALRVYKDQTLQLPGMPGEVAELYLK